MVVLCFGRYSVVFRRGLVASRERSVVALASFLQDSRPAICISEHNGHSLSPCLLPSGQLSIASNKHPKKTSVQTQRQLPGQLVRSSPRSRPPIDNRRSCWSCTSRDRYSRNRNGCRTNHRRRRSWDTSTTTGSRDNCYGFTDNRTRTIS